MPYHGDYNVKLQGTEAEAIVGMAANIEIIKDKNNTVQIDQETVNANNVIIKAVESTLAHTDVTVGIASVVALAANPNRKYALLINEGDVPMYLKFGSVAEMNKGIRIGANGGGYEISAAYGNLDLRVINAISSEANKTLLVTEGI